MSELTMTLDLDKMKKICACVPFISDDAGIPETQAAMCELINEVEILRNDIEKLMNVLDTLSYIQTVGPAVFSNICEAGQYEIRCRVKLADEARQSTVTWKRAELESDELK